MGTLPEGYLEIYKLAVEMADRISARRAAASSFFLTAESALLALAGAATENDWAFALPGVVLAITWWLLLRSYRHLNSAKFKVIQELEEQLPVAPFRDEWLALKPSDATRRRRERYFELGVVERVVPLVFAVMFLAFIVGELL